MSSKGRSAPCRQKISVRRWAWRFSVGREETKHDLLYADFSVFHSLSVILFIEKGDSEVALQHFHDAAALAEPYSLWHSAMAWLHLGYIHRNRNELEDAYQATVEVVRLQPERWEAHYR